EAANLTQTQGTAVSIQNNGTASIVVDTTTITQNETLSFVANAVNSERKETFTFEVIADEGTVDPDPTPDPSGDEWDAAKTYLGGEVVSYADGKWKAQWWIEGGDDPQTTYQKDQWGVWRPAS
ncbi:MAG: chitin-binding protein, partial [Pseudomonadota bacterium]